MNKSLENLINRPIESIILIGLFIRPFIAESAFKLLGLFIDITFIVLIFLYIFKKPLPRKPIDWACFIFFLSLMFSLIFTANITGGLLKFYQYTSLLFIFYFIRLNNILPKNKLLLIFSLSAFFVSVYSLRCLFFISAYVLKNYTLPNTFAAEFITRERAFSPFISPNLLAGYLAIVFMTCLGVTVKILAEKKKTLILPINITSLIIILITVFLTKSLGVLIILTIAIFLFLLLTKLINKKTLLIIALFISVFLSIANTRSKNINTYTQPNFSLSQRIDYTKNTLEIIKNHPWVGTGIGNFSLPQTRYTHNSYLQIWAELGLLPLLAWLAIVFIFLNRFILLLQTKVDYQELGIFLGGLVFLLHNLIDFSFFIGQVSFLWWAILGLVFHISDKTNDHNAKPAG